MADLSGLWTPNLLDKTQVRTVVNAVDDWVEDNIVSLNQAIPAPERALMTVDQKALILTFVVMRRRAKD